MSYILDALRKADADRDLGRVPTLHAHPAGASDGPAEPARASFAHAAGRGAALAIGALVGLVILLSAQLWSARPAPSDRPAAGASPVPMAAAPTPATTAPASAPPSMPQATAAAPAAGRSTPLAQTQAETEKATAAPGAEASGSPTAVSRAAPAATRPTSGTTPAATKPTSGSTPATVRTASGSTSAPSPRPTPKPDPKPAPKPAPERATSARTAAPGAVPRAGGAARPTAPATVPSIESLPDDVRRRLPPVAVSGSIYSADPASRMLIVNGQLLREGEAVAPDVVIERIELKSAVLRAGDLRYRVGF